MKKFFKRAFIVLGIAAILLGINILLVLFGLFKSPISTEETILEAEEESVEEEIVNGAYYYVAEDMELLALYQEYNPDVVGIIRIDDTCLNHPAVRTPEDEDYYLLRDLDGNYNSHGVPFMSVDSEMEQYRGNVIIYGHNIRLNGTDVFGELSGYEDLSYYKEHPIITTVSDSGTRDWLIFAYYLVDNSDENAFQYSETTSYLSLEEFNEYIGQVKARNWLNVPVELSIEDTYLVLSSCSVELSDEDSNRMVVMAKLLDAHEDYSRAVEKATMALNPLLPEKLQEQ